MPAIAGKLKKSGVISFPSGTPQTKESDANNAINWRNVSSQAANLQDGRTGRRVDCDSSREIAIADHFSCHSAAVCMGVHCCQ
jgi:hypothetical protein